MPCRAPLLVVLLGLGALACPSSDESSPPPAPIPDAVQRAFEGGCMHEGCHDAASAAAGLSLDSADSQAIVGGPSTQSDLPLVVVGDLAGSYMAIKLLPDDQLPRQLPLDPRGRSGRARRVVHGRAARRGELRA